MPYASETVDLAAEQQRLEEAYREAKVRAEELDRDADGYEAAVTEASEARTHYNAIQYLRDEYDAESVTFGKLTGGEYARVTDRMGDLKSQKVGHGPSGGAIQGAAQLYWAGMSLVEAPFISDGDGFEERVEAVRDLPAEVTRWLASEASDRSSLDDALGNASGV